MRKEDDRAQNIRKVSYEERLYRELKTAKERVMYILEHYPETRNNDLYLWLIYVRLFEPELSKYIKFVPYDVLKRATSYETIRRVRQKIQNELKLYPPTDPEVIKKRRKRERAFRNVIKKV